MGKNLVDAMATVSQLLEEAERAAGDYADDPQNWHARHHHEMDKLRVLLQSQHGARISSRWDNQSVLIAGIRSSSTSGLAGALRNWMKAARRRIEQEAGR